MANIFRKFPSDDLQDNEFENYESLFWTKDRQGLNAYEIIEDFWELPASGNNLTKILADTLSLAESYSNGYGKFPADTLSLNDALVKTIGIGIEDILRLEDSTGKMYNKVLDYEDTLTLIDELGKSISIAKSDSVTLEDLFDYLLTFGILKRWNGTTWEIAQLKVYDGGNFVIKPLKIWDGSEWKTVKTL